MRALEVRASASLSPEGIHSSNLILNQSAHTPILPLLPHPQNPRTFSCAPSPNSEASPKQATHLFRLNGDPERLPRGQCQRGSSVRSSHLPHAVPATPGHPAPHPFRMPASPLPQWRNRLPPAGRPPSRPPQSEIPTRRAVASNHSPYSSLTTSSLSTSNESNQRMP